VAVGEVKVVEVQVFLISTPLGRRAKLMSTPKTCLTRMALLERTSGGALELEWVVVVVVVVVATRKMALDWGVMVVVVVVVVVVATRKMALDWGALVVVVVVVVVVMATRKMALDWGVVAVVELVVLLLLQLRLLVLTELGVNLAVIWDL
jgi:hypothetical protein